MKTKQKHQRFAEAMKAEQMALERFSAEISEQERNPGVQADLAPVVRDLIRRKEMTAKKQVWSDLGRKRAKARHKEDDELRELMRAKWAEGKHTSRNQCAKHEWENLGFRRESTARRSLLNTPEPERS